MTRIVGMTQYSHRLAVYLLSSILICCLPVTGAMADATLAWATNTCGGERMSGCSETIILSLGQLTIGENVSGRSMSALGVLSADQPAPPRPPSPGAAKLWQDGSHLALADLVVSSSPGVFSDRIYAQAPDRSSGIAIVGGRGEAATATEGSHVNLLGAVSTLNGERVMLNPMVARISDGDKPQALGMTNRVVGGAALGFPPSGQRGVYGGVGLNNAGLLVKTTGLVIDDSYSQYILINDGSWTPLWETGLRVAKANLNPIPEIGSYIEITGISSVRVRGSVLDAIIKPRCPEDVSVIAPAQFGSEMQRAVGGKEE